MKAHLFTQVACALCLFACAPPVAEQVWLGLDGRPVRGAQQAKQFEAAGRLCEGLDRGYGILGVPTDLMTSCMASQGYFRVGSLEASSRPGLLP